MLLLLDDHRHTCSQAGRPVYLDRYFHLFGNHVYYVYCGIIGAYFSLKQAYKYLLS